jgi:hypothetical protein
MCRQARRRPAFVDDPRRLAAVGQERTAIAVEELFDDLARTLAPSADLPDGLLGDLAVQPLLQKDSASPQTQITLTTPAVLSHRGALAIVTNVGTGCGGRGSVRRET